MSTRTDALIWKLLPWIPVVIIAVAWSVYWAIVHPPLAVLPSLAEVFGAVVEKAQEGRLAVDIGASLWRLLLGALLGIAMGVVAGFLVGLNKALAEFPDDVEAAARQALSNAGSFLAPTDPAAEPWPPMRVKPVG